MTNKSQTHIDNLYTELDAVWDELTTWYQALTYRYPASHLDREIFDPEKYETEHGWYVTIALPAGNEYTRPIPDEFIHKFRHLDVGAEIEYDDDPASFYDWKERLLRWATR